MNHLKWEENKAIKQVICIHTDAKKYSVANKLTIGKEYDLQNETEEFYFIKDDSNRIAGFYKDYFADVK